MKKITLLVIIMITFLTSCAQEDKSFTEDALNERFTTFEGEQISFQDILAKYEGKTVFVDIWASWCSDCVRSIPEFKKLQKNNKDLVFLMLSVDKTFKEWQEGIEKHSLDAAHYLITKGWKQSVFCKSIDLDWIPRYLIIGKDGSIKLFKAIKLDAKKIKTVIASERKIERK